ncbi:MAG: [acyl-carrier-protein] S-malonyltransferase [Candidatus Latescibacteria bacterium 4484_7]|nr:MAG: [acyl-carrier-protein] S-malonyltransferase [Candidatus Latescibacteria bacterium 4484_7]
MDTAMIFPGQGSQFVGMGKDLADEFSLAREMFLEANDILGFNLSKVCFEGDAETLTETRNAQPAILLISSILSAIMKEEEGIEPKMVAGHSLGEYSALVSAGVFDWRDALKIVRRRGELMFEAGLKQPGTMGAILGLSQEEVEEICREASGEEIVVIANINSPGQIVVSGHIGAVKKAMGFATEKGARKVVQLNVSGAFHSPLVASAQNELTSYIREFPMNDSTVGIICNADAKIIHKKEEIIDALSRQLTSPVRWLESMRVLIDNWNGSVLEVGPGRVLAGLMKRIDRAVPVQTVGTVEELMKVIAPEIEMG